MRTLLERRMTEMLFRIASIALFVITLRAPRKNFKLLWVAGGIMLVLGLWVAYTYYNHLLGIYASLPTETREEGSLDWYPLVMTFIVWLLAPIATLLALAYRHIESRSSV